MRFDWYQTTIEANPMVVLEEVRKLGHSVSINDKAARQWRYSQGWDIEHRDRGVVARVFAGGNGLHPHALATGSEAEEFACLVRDKWPQTHLVTRCDAAQDFNEAGAYRRLKRVARRVAKRHGLKFPAIEDQLNPTAGRTQYVGSPSSNYRARIYEKGFEELGKLQALYMRQGFNVTPESVVTITNSITGEQVRPEDWTRAELQCRPPQESSRRAAAVLTPQEIWGCSPWALDLAKEAMALDLERIVMRTRKISKDEEALRWMCKNYGNMLSRLHSDLGDWPCVGLEIGRILKDQARD
jgi:hypothetical protein